MVPAWWGLGGAALLEAGSEYKKPDLLPVYSPSFVLTFEDVSPQLPAPAAMPAACCHASSLTTMDSSPFGTRGQNKLFLKLPLARMLYHSIRKRN